MQDEKRQQAKLEDLREKVGQDKARLRELALELRAAAALEDPRAVKLYAQAKDAMKKHGVSFDKTDPKKELLRKD